MVKYTGTAVGNNVAIGFARKKVNSDRVFIKQGRGVDTETERFESAGIQVQKQLMKLAENEKTVLQEIGEGIFDGHCLILQDGAFRQSILQMLRDEDCSAEYAVSEICEKYEKRFAQMEDAYLQARAADIRDLKYQLLGCLKGRKIDNTSEEYILVTREILPSDVLEAERDKLLGIVSVEGTMYSHGAILASALKIPTILGVQLDLELLQDGQLIIVDEEGAQVVTEPDEKFLETAKAKMKRQECSYDAIRDRKACTRSGQGICLKANAGSLAEVDAAAQNGAEGIGLFRSEFLYLGRSELPDEDEQFELYKKILERMHGKPVTIRTLDLGGDKQAPCVILEEDENPAIGYRAIRICLDRKDIFMTQLRALLRAGCYGDLSILYPMITSLEEVYKIKGFVTEAMAELERQNIPYILPKQGIMIETPAAVLMSAELAAEVDFFSIGTNDLTQFTLAADRQNSKLKDVYNPYHPAIKKMIRMTMDSAKHQGIPVEICGELAADPNMTTEFLKWGVDILSMAPPRILPLKQMILEME